MATCMGMTATTKWMRPTPSSASARAMSLPRCPCPDGRRLQRQAGRQRQARTTTDAAGRRQGLRRHQERRPRRPPAPTASPAPTLGEQIAPQPPILGGTDSPPAYLLRLPRLRAAAGGLWDILPMTLFTGIGARPGVALAAAARLRVDYGVASLSPERLRRIAARLRAFGVESPEPEQVILVADTLPPGFHARRGRAGSGRHRRRVRRAAGPSARLPGGLWAGGGLLGRRHRRRDRDRGRQPGPGLRLARRLRHRPLPVPRDTRPPHLSGGGASACAHRLRRAVTSRCSPPPSPWTT